MSALASPAPPAARRLPPEPRRIRDWLEFANIINDPDEIIGLLMDAGIIRDERVCPRIGCGGTLRAKKSRRPRYAKNGGWCYLCKGGSVYHSKSILFGTLWYRTNYSLQTHMKMLFHYAMFQQRVCLLYIFHVSYHVSTPCFMHFYLYMSTYVH